MTAILREVLRYHLAAGGYAMALSATLGSRGASALTSTPQPSRAEAVVRPYPLVTTVKPDVERIAVTSEAAPKPVAVERATIADDPAAVSARALQIAKAGGRVLVVRNTVRDCIETQIELERIARASDLLFGVGELPAPHHARFTRVDRLLLDQSLEARFGKGASVPCVAIATQTVQQSLDIDADLMLTDLAPMDVLLQRIGRVHRHCRERAPEYRQARVIVLLPGSRDLSSLINSSGAAHGPHGLGTVYEDLRVLEATWRAIEELPVLEIPAMNRRLIEAATHPETLAAIATDKLWKHHGQTIHGQSMAVRGLAALNCVRRDIPFSDCRFPTTLEARISARLGIDDRVVEMSGATGPFGAAINRLTIPGWLVPGAQADAEAEQVTAAGGVIHFNFAGRSFTYDRLGLRPDATEAGEDLTDA